MMPAVPKLIIIYHLMILFLMDGGRKTCLEKLPRKMNGQLDLTCPDLGAKSIRTYEGPRSYEPHPR